MTTCGASPKLGAYIVLVALGLIGSLASGRPEPVVLAAPFAVAVAAGLARGAPRAELLVAVTLGRDRILEGDDLDVEVILEAPNGFDHLDVVLILPLGLVVVEGENPRTLTLSAGEPRTLLLTLRAQRWGAYAVGDIIVRARDRTGLFVLEGRFGSSSGLRVLPHPDELRDLIRPVHTLASTGNRTARAKAAGIEFADLRPFTAGDRAREVNWRASARRGALWVNQRHPERNTDVVLFLDTFTAGAVPVAVRIVASLLAAYAGERDRVALVSFGGTLGWVEPGTGLGQQYRILDALLTTTVVFSYAWSGIATLPRRTLPPRALVLAVSALDDERSVAALMELGGRGVDLAIIEVVAEDTTAPGRGEAGELAHRLWSLQRDVLRTRFIDLGVPVARWRPGRTAQELLEEVRAFRRQSRRPAG